MWIELTFLWNERTILWNDLTWNEMTGYPMTFQDFVNEQDYFNPTKCNIGYILNKLGLASNHV